MTRQDIEKSVLQVVSDNFGIRVEDLTLNTSFIDDLNADSLDTVEIAMELEEEFDISISDGDTEKMETINDTVDYLCQRLIETERV